MRARFPSSSEDKEVSVYTSQFTKLLHFLPKKNSSLRYFAVQSRESQSTQNIVIVASRPRDVR
jgi:hypothetical protein